MSVTPSRIGIIRMAEADDASGAHLRLGGAPTDRSSEGIAVSPDGTLVVAINRRQTATPATSPQHTREASATPLSLDPATGALMPVAQVEVPAVLPEGATFARSGTMLLVTAFERQDASGGALFAFAVEGDGAKARLVARGAAPTSPGVHHVVVR